MLLQLACSLVHKEIQRFTLCIYILSRYCNFLKIIFSFYFQEVQHNCQLHRISFCADDKTDKRIFTFICKDSESNKHLCYVFDSEKCVSMQDALKEFG